MCTARPRSDRVPLVCSSVQSRKGPWETSRQLRLERRSLYAWLLDAVSWWRSGHGWPPSSVLQGHMGTSWTECVADGRDTQVSEDAVTTCVPSECLHAQRGS